MIEKTKVYKCAKCGNLVEALWNGQPDPSCCGEVMKARSWSASAPR